MDMIAEVNMLGGVSVTGQYHWRPTGLGQAGRLLLASVDGETVLAGHDGRGNITSYSDAFTGDLRIGREYTPFGETIRDSVEDGGDHVDIPFGFKGEYLDRETGLVYHGHRYYDPHWGRFISRDPIGEAGGANLYAYAGNDPVNKRDLWGLTTVDDDEDDLTPRPAQFWDGRKWVNIPGTEIGAYAEDSLSDYLQSLASLMISIVGRASNSAPYHHSPPIDDWATDYQDSYTNPDTAVPRAEPLPIESVRNEKAQGENRGISVEFEVVIRDASDIGATLPGVKASATFVVDPNTGQLLSENASIGSTNILGFEVPGGGKIDTIAIYDSKSGTWNIGFRGSVYSTTLRFAEGAVTGIMGHPNATLNIDFALQVQFNPTTRTGIYGAVHDAYPSYSIRVGGSTVYDFQQTSVLMLDPPVNESRTGKFRF